MESIDRDIFSDFFSQEICTQKYTENTSKAYLDEVSIVFLIKNWEQTVENRPQQEPKFNSVSKLALSRKQK
jgi:hypothetical protein